MDVTEQKKSEERLLHDAVHDNLTGLPNRELFMNWLEAILSIAKSEEHVRPTVFVIDIDRFKQVNDGLGISAGDTILLDGGTPAPQAVEAQGRPISFFRRPVCNAAAFRNRIRRESQRSPKL